MNQCRQVGEHYRERMHDTIADQRCSGIAVWSGNCQLATTKATVGVVAERGNGKFQNLLSSKLSSYSAGWTLQLGGNRYFLTAELRCLPMRRLLGWNTDV